MWFILQCKFLALCESICYLYEMLELKRNFLDIVKMKYYKLNLHLEQVFGSLDLETAGDHLPHVHLAFLWVECCPSPNSFRICPSYSGKVFQK